MSAWNYVVTAHKPTIVTHSCVGNFVSPTELNLIIAKCTRIEIHSITPEDLKLVLDVPVYGRIAALELFSVRGETQNLLFIATDQYKYCVLQWDPEASRVITRTKGDVSDQKGHPTDNAQIGIIDPDCKLIGLHIYDGLFKVIPFGEKGKLEEAFSIRFEPKVLDFKFLYGRQKPTLAVLYQAINGARLVKAYDVPLEFDRCTTRRSWLWAQNNLDKEASLLIPVLPPLCGVLIIGEETIVYCDTSAVKYTIATKCSIRVTAHGRVDGYQYLLGDHNGILHLLVITHEKEKVTGLQVNQLGETSIASTISYLGNSFVYIGSSSGDSQLVKLNLQPGANGDRVEVLDNYVSLGPIVDFCVVDLEKQGQGQVVTCSGARKDGSLRVLWNGIEINEEVFVEFEGIKGMWSLRSATDDPYDTFLVISFIGEIRVLKANPGYELCEIIDIEDLSSQYQTLFCHDAIHDQLVQVTSNSVRLLSSTSLKLKVEWCAPADYQITVATANATQVMLAFAAGDGHYRLVYLEIGNGVLNEVKFVLVDSDISCLDINPAGEKPNFSSIAAVGMWKDISVSIYSLPELNLIKKEVLGEKTIPRSILMCSFEGTSYLLCALGDGHLLHFELDMNTGELTDRKKVSLGTQPITLRTFSFKEATRVFAASNRPTVIYSSNKRLLFSDVNLEKVNHMCPFNLKGSPNSLAIAKEGNLTIGTIDEKQKLHIRSIPLGEHARRISHQKQSRSFAICSVKYKNGDDSETLVRLLDDQTCMSKSTYCLNQFEYGCSILSCSFSDDSDVYYCVGTAYVVPKETEPTRGRILVLRVEDGGLLLIAEKETDGAVYSLNAFNGKLLAAINQKIQLYQWAFREDGRSRELQPECFHRGDVPALFIQTRGDFIVVGDPVKSISLLIFKEGVIKELARDYNANWMTAVEILNDHTYLVAGDDCNLFTVRKHSEGSTDEQSRLEVVGEYHLGEFVNRFQHGSLVMQLRDLKIPKVIFGTVNGVIGVIASLPHEQYQLLEKLQTSLRKLINGVGELSNEQWRSSRRQRLKLDFKNFLDGDLIESFLHISWEKKEEISREMKVPFEELVKIVEEMTMLHSLSL